MILRIKFNKKNYLRYISHLDLMRLFHRSFNRAGIPVEYSQGFNPQPKFSIASPLSLGIESEEEYMDIHLKDMDVEDFIERMNKVLPKDVQILKGEYVKNEESIASLISWAYYEIKFKTMEESNMEDFEKVLNTWLNQDEIILTRTRKKGKKIIQREVNIKSLMGNIIIKDINGENLTLEVLLRSGDGGNLNPMDFMTVLNRDIPIDIDMDSISIKRLGLYAEKDDNIYKPL